MRKIKTRENAKNIKILDKSAVVGQRMKSAFIRSKRNVAALMDDRQTTPSEYAEDKVQVAADNLAHDTANMAVSGTKTVVRQGRKLFQRQREKQAAEKRQENTTPTEQAPTPEPSQGAAPEGQPPQRRTDPALEGRLPRQRTCTALERQSTPAQAQRSGLRWERKSSGMSELCPTERSEGYGACDDEERGRAFVKKQAAKWIEQKQQAKNRAVQSGRPPQQQIKAPDVSQAPRQTETVINFVGTPIKTTKRPAQVARQAPKKARNAVKCAQRTIKTAQRTPKTAVKTANHTVRTAQKTAQTAAQAIQATTKAARATAQTAATAAKRGFTAVKAIIASIKTLVSAIAAGGWIAVLIIVMICLFGLMVSSPFGIFFSGQNSGVGQTMPTVVREINQDYESELEGIKTLSSYDLLEISGSSAVWPEVLAVYAVKTTTDPNKLQEVATMDNSKKALLNEIFWAMNGISSYTRTSTTTQSVERDDGEGNIIEEEVEVTTTTLYVIVTHKTANEMADAYHFTTDQRAQLAELLADENRGMWNSVLYGIGAGSGDIVAVALS